MGRAEWIALIGLALCGAAYAAMLTWIFYLHEPKRKGDRK